MVQIDIQSDSAEGVPDVQSLLIQWSAFGVPAAE